MSKRSGNAKQPIDVALAVRLFHLTRSWPAVAQLMARPDGVRFQTQSIINAVRRMVAAAAGRAA